MKFIVPVLLSLALCGCVTTPPVPVTAKFPEVPQILLERCPQLKTIDGEKDSLRDFLKTVIENYATYYQCADKAHSWQDWYREIKKYYEDIK
jgi:hypothetical protein